MMLSAQIVANRNLRKGLRSPSSPQRGEVPSECEAMRGATARAGAIRNHSEGGLRAPSSGALRHLLPAGEKREMAEHPHAIALLLKGAKSHTMHIFKGPTL